MDGHDEYRHAAHQILTHPLRRFVLSYLNGQQGHVTLGRLVDDYVAHLREQRADTGVDTERLQVRFHHVHLPHLSEAGLIDYDPDELRITEWRHPNLHEQWLTDTPVEPLAETLVSVTNSSGSD